MRVKDIYYQITREVEDECIYRCQMYYLFMDYKKFIETTMTD